MHYDLFADIITNKALFKEAKLLIIISNSKKYIFTIDECEFHGGAMGLQVIEDDTITYIASESVQSIEFKLPVEYHADELGNIYKVEKDNNNCPIKQAVFEDMMKKSMEN